MVPYLILVVSLPGLWNSASAQEGLQERFLNEAPAAWQEGEKEFLSGVSGVLEVTNFSRDGNSSRQQWQLHCKGNKRLLQLDGRAFGFNGIYGFEVMMNSQEDWIVRRVIPADSSDAMHWMMIDSNSIQAAGRSPFATRTCRLARLVLHPGFRVTRIAEEDGVVEVRFEFDGELNMPDSADFSVELSGLKSGELRVDPSNFWALLESKLEYSGSGFSTRLKYPSATDGPEGKPRLPISVDLEPGLASEEAFGYGNSANIQCRWDLSGSSLDDRLFTLAHFGLSEPPFATQDSWSIPGWTLPVCGLVAVVAFCIGLRAWDTRRRKGVAEL